MCWPPLRRSVIRDFEISFWIFRCDSPNPSSECTIAALCVLQFLPDTSNPARHASDGGGIDRSHVEAGRIVSVVIAHMRTSFYYSCMPKALADQIVELTRQGIIPVPFGVEDVRKHFSEFSEGYLMTVLPTFEKNGYMVLRAKQRARFERVGEGLYKPILKASTQV